MIKKLIIYLFVFICLLRLCSCSTSTTTYEESEKIGMNYNNISNYNGFWLTSDSICYLDGSIIPKYYLIDKNAKTKICMSSGYGSGKIQRYDNKIYILDEVDFVNECNSKFKLKVYDVNLKETTTIFSIKNCDNFLVLDGDIYYLEYSWENNVRVLTLKKYSDNLNKYDTIKNGILSFGVIKNNIFYIAEEENNIVIFRYDNETKSAIRSGEFSLESINAKNFTDNVRVSYTDDYLLFSWIDYKSEKSEILKYSFKNNTLNNITVEGYIDGFISYDNCSYFIISYERSNNSELYKFNNDTNEIFKIAKFLGEGCLFVGSDKGAYVLEYNSNVLKYYSDQGNSQIICKF